MITTTTTTTITTTIITTKGVLLFDVERYKKNNILSDLNEIALANANGLLLLFIIVLQ